MKKYNFKVDTMNECDFKHNVLNGQKQNVLKNHKKQLHQHAIQVQQAHLRSEIAFCISEEVVIITVKILLLIH